MAPRRRRSRGGPTTAGFREVARPLRSPIASRSREFGPSRAIRQQSRLTTIPSLDKTALNVGNFSPTCPHFADLSRESPRFPTVILIGRPQDEPVPRSDRMPVHPLLTCSDRKLTRKRFLSMPGQGHSISSSRMPEIPPKASQIATIVRGSFDCAPLVLPKLIMVDRTADILQCRWLKSSDDHRRAGMEGSI
jgi:hypothetical protein